MAAVTQCDVCSNTCKNEDSKCIKVYRRSHDGTLANVVHYLEVCPNCYGKLCGALNLKAKV